MSNGDHDRLRDAIAEARGNMGRSCMVSNAAIEILVAAAESTLPKTETVELWHCEYAELEFCRWVAKIRIVNSKSGAETFGALLRDAPLFSCVRITGPHKHDVPA